MVCMRNYFRGIMTALLLLTCMPHSGKEINVSALKNKASETGSLEKINIYRDIANHYLTENTDSALKYARKVWVLSKKQKNDTSEYAGLMMISSCFENKALYDSAVFYTEIALQTARETGDSYMTANALNTIGKLYLLWNEPLKARKYYRQSLKAAEKTGNARLIAAPYQNIGITYHSVKDYKTAIEYYMKGLKMLEKTDHKQGIAVTWLNIGNIYNEWGKTDKAIESYLTGDSLLKEINAAHERINLLNSIAVAYKNKGEPEKGVQYLKEGIELSAESKSEQHLFSLYYNLANFYHLQEEYILAQDYLAIATDLAEKANNAYWLFVSINLKAVIAAKQEKYTLAFQLMDSLEAMITPKIPINILMDFYKGYSDLCRETGNYPKSMKYFEKYVEIKDSVFSRENNEKLLNFQIKQEAEKQEQQIKLKNIRIRMQKLWLYITLGGIFLLLCFLLVILRLFYLKQRSNKELARKNLELAKSEKTLKSAGNQTVAPAESSKPERPQPSSEHKQAVIDRITNLMDNEKRYLKEYITLGGLAIELDTNTTYLAMIIKEHFKKTFVDLVNSYRVKEARILLSESNRNYSLDDIAKMAGFSSRSAFNRAFKKHTGIAPSFYAKSIQ